MDSIGLKLERIKTSGIKYHPDNFESLRRAVADSNDHALAALWFDICEQWLEMVYMKIAKTEQRSEVDSTWRSHWEEAFKAKKNLEQEIERLRTEFGFKKMRHTSGTGLTERKRQPGPSGGNTDQMLTATQAADYLGIKISYLYKLSSKGSLPKYNPGGKIIFFAKTDLEAYKTRNRTPSVTEIVAQGRKSISARARR